jgi:hypothetical protein
MTITAPYGSLTVPPRARADFDRAVAYLSRDAGERELFDRLEHGAHAIRLATNAHDDDSYDPATHTINWDPHSALRTTAGGSQSPALGLGHEVDHAVEDDATREALGERSVRGYDTAEERRVIRGSEAAAARTLGEGVRYDHRGTVYRVDAPTAMLLA